MQKTRAHFSAVIRKTRKKDQFIKIHGEEVAALLSKSRYEEVSSPRNSLINFFYSVPDEIVNLEIT